MKFECVVFGKILNVFKRRRKSKLNGLGGQTSFWVAELQYEFQWAICSDGGIQNGFLNKPAIISFGYFDLNICVSNSDLLILL